MMHATAFEYRHRYTVHGLIYILCFAAPWTLFLPAPFHAPVWSFVQNNSTWFLLTNQLTKPLYQHFALTWNAILLVIIAFAGAGAVLRVWGAAYLGASTVHRGGMLGEQVIAEGPYRFTRNPLYLGTLLSSVALAFLMRPEAAVLALVLLTVVQYRLIGREEPYLADRLGADYAAYRASVPRLWPSLRPGTSRGDNRPRWWQGILSELYVIGVVLTLVLAGWSRGYTWEGSVLHVMQGIIVSLGVSVIARAFIPKAQF